MSRKKIVLYMLILLAGILLAAFFVFHDRVLDLAIALREWSKSTSGTDLERILRNREVHFLLTKVDGSRHGDVRLFFFTYPAGREEDVLALFPAGGQEGDHFDYMREMFQKYVKIHFESRPSRCLKYAMPRGLLYLALWPEQRANDFNGIILYIEILGPG
jgi:hypothetical protein